MNPRQLREHPLAALAARVQAPGVCACLHRPTGLCQLETGPEAVLLRLLPPSNFPPLRWGNFVMCDRLLCCVVATTRPAELQSQLVR